MQFWLRNFWSKLKMAPAHYVLKLHNPNKINTTYIDGDAKLMRNFNIDGCRRRRGVPGRSRPRFRCDGDIGPPCVVKRGDTVYLDVDFGSGTICCW